MFKIFVVELGDVGLKPLWICFWKRFGGSWVVCFLFTCYLYLFLSVRHCVYRRDFLGEKYGKTAVCSYYNIPLLSRDAVAGMMVDSGFAVWDLGDDGVEWSGNQCAGTAPPLGEAVRSKNSQQPPAEVFFVEGE